MLTPLTESESLQVRTYVNGTLYSILTRPSLREQAQEVGLEDILKALEPRCEEQFARQIRSRVLEVNASSSIELWMLAHACVTTT